MNRKKIASPVHFESTNGIAHEILEKVTLLAAAMKRVETALFGDKEAGTSGVIHRVEQVEDRISDVERSKAGSASTVAYVQKIEEEISTIKADKAGNTELRVVETAVRKNQDLISEMRGAAKLLTLLWTILLGLLAVVEIYRR